MKQKGFLAAMLAVFLAEILAAVLFFTGAGEDRLDTVAVNRVLQTVTRHWGQLNGEVLPADLDYTVLDRDGKILFKTREGLSGTINEAIANRDTILDVTAAETVVGRVLIHNGSEERMAAKRQKEAILLAVSISIQAIICAGYLIFLNWRIFRPFSRLRSFAGRVASGDLEIPLVMERDGAFGAFSESFDLMRSELKKARIAEAAANESKKELVAKLSHDIRTPVASIKAISEVGGMTAKSEKDRRGFELVGEKADQLNTLVNELFHAALEDLHQLKVCAEDRDSAELSAILGKSDYRNLSRIGEIPACLLFYDPLRMQQVFDNLITNSYKYAGTGIEICFRTGEDCLEVRIEDHGGGVEEEELPGIFEKYARGKNAAGKEGAGLGLYLSRYLMRQMGGDLCAENTEDGFAVIAFISMSGRL